MDETSEKITISNVQKCILVEKYQWTSQQLKIQEKSNETAEPTALLLNSGSPAG